MKGENLEPVYNRVWVLSSVLDTLPAHSCRLMQIYLVVHIFNWLLGHQKPQLTSWQNWRRFGLDRVAEWEAKADAEAEAEVDIQFALDALQKFMRPSWGRWADDDRACQVCVGSCLVTTTAWQWDWHWHWHRLSPFAIAEPQSWCSLSWIFHVIHDINGICMYVVSSLPFSLDWP